MQLTISLIVPVFNTREEYLRECLDSVATQTYSNMEVIVVNDGCTDNSPEVIQEYVEKDSRFSIHDKENGGLSSARNKGIEKATGAYIMFLDSDDFLISDSLVSDISELLAESNADLLSFEYNEIFADNEYPRYISGSCPREEVYKKDSQAALKTLLKKPRTCFSSVAVTKVVKTDLIHRNMIYFQDRIYHEDVLYTSMLIRNAKTYDRLDKVAYAVRRSNPESITTNITINKIIKRLEDFSFVFDKVLSDEENKNNECLLDFLASPYAYYLGLAAGVLYHSDDKDEKAEIKDKIKNMKRFAFVLKHTSRFEVKIVCVIYHLFGMKITLLILQLYFKVNNKHVLSINRKMG
jgi:glycosyltransferase involved in cell wall biosynthesis